jgi:hypothetical protein
MAGVRTWSDYANPFCDPDLRDGTDSLWMGFGSYAAVDAALAGVVGWGVYAGAGGAQVCAAGSGGGVVPLVPCDGSMMLLIAIRR